MSKNHTFCQFLFLGYLTKNATSVSEHAIQYTDAVLHAYLGRRLHMLKPVPSNSA